MKKLNLRINFFLDDEDDIWEFTLTVPDDINVIRVEEILLKAHRYLKAAERGRRNAEDETDLYGTNGRNPVTLLDYVCREYGWSWEDYSFDIDLNFN